ncbi:hypothetical protein [Treponema sp. UBA3813]|nr:hypothetical protein [Treponema sp. UBA3813]
MVDGFVKNISGMNEMATGADQITEAVNTVNAEISPEYKKV